MATPKQPVIFGPSADMQEIAEQFADMQKLTEQFADACKKALREKREKTEKQAEAVFSLSLGEYAKLDIRGKSRYLTEIIQFLWRIFNEAFEGRETTETLEERIKAFIDLIICGGIYKRELCFFNLAKGSMFAWIENAFCFESLEGEDPKVLKEKITAWMENFKPRVPTGSNINSLGRGLLIYLYKIYGEMLKT